MSARRSLWLAGIALGLAALAAIATPALAAEPVKVWEEPLVIPTYLTGEPEALPMFYQGRAYQGAQGRVYPYRLLDQLTDVKQDKTYKALYLENEYLKVCVLPEVGGRLFYVLDKTDGHDLFYHQHVIKPALIGMLGAWISGGVEWCAIHHHRATSFQPVDFTLSENADGSKTIWIGETELRQRMRWEIGLTLYSGKSYLQSTVRIVNRTSYAQSCLYWANAAVTAGPGEQVIFPPSVEMATYHSKNQFSHWPVSRERYSGSDYTAGVDVSWIKNNLHWNSFFAWNCQEDFLGAYDHARDAGVVAIADHAILPGKKLWTWGNDEHARMWEKILTDADGPYAEAMIGGYSDNQPDYSWLQPYESRVFSHYWYPLTKIGGVKNANLEAAVNLEIADGNRVRVGVNTSSARKGARIALGRAGIFAGTPFWQERADVGPAAPFTKEVEIPAGMGVDSLRLSVSDANGEELISFQPSPLKDANPPLPPTVKPPAAPKDIATVEELYLTGQRIEQFHSAAAEPYPYYEEALKRDGGNSQVNTALGVLYCKRGMYAKAKDCLDLAVARVAKDYVHPRDGEALYYLGVALRGLGDADAATDAFSRAAWSQAWTSAACYSLAELACEKAQWQKALAFLDRSLAANALNAKAVDLKAAVLRSMGRLEDAQRLVEAQLLRDPLDFWAANELYMVQAETKSPAAAKVLKFLGEQMRNAVPSYLELAVDYGDAGLWTEARAVLDRAIAAGGKTADPLLAYYRTYYQCAIEPSPPAKVAAKASATFSFPFQLEAIRVLKVAGELNPLDAQAPYLLGNLLYDIQPEEAVKAWEESARRDDAFFIVHRNLGMAYARDGKDSAKAIAEYEKAISCEPNEPKLYYELDQLYEAANVAPAKRLAMMQAHQDVVAKRDDSLEQEIKLLTVLGQTDKALELLGSRHFRLWEGSREINVVSIDAHLSKGLALLRDGKVAEALKEFQSTLVPPANVDVYEVGDRAAQVQYCIGLAYQAMGDKAKAKSAFEQVSAGSGGRRGESSEARAFVGLALKAMGQEQQAGEVFAAVIKGAEDRLKASEGEDYFAKFGRRQSAASRQADSHYLLGLGYLGQGDRSKAKSQFEQALELNQAHLWAKYQLSALADR
jgi:tetratricopeptide (TPR) repeat protein